MARLVRVNNGESKGEREERSGMGFLGFERQRVSQGESEGAIIKVLAFFYFLLYFFIYTLNPYWICRFGIPRHLLSAYGTPFIDAHVWQLLEKYVFIM